ncbi:hypothetical protein PF005_g32269 [Phytophthora fragariae]|uniref:Uncharacterized protein n=1 Tax=Phytophthora fragariae TaxID=53985 RepID=A0A6A3V3D9_9STRA|nr:hypothetical protein PF003_g20511 [Phytophthora fragariae]KAE8916932.1 hypothetical protein PF009_g32746 [Phytophthora fragariae]KAE9054001.1 hypothetical protein PF007_g32771 [Phytophthora fragariae]KAE9056277.1 hypothetical protein PF006_g32727 [Phytophthora fragariae]KAE9061867.1 hypothetical protein PF010_g29650 [Phytophthora fragariae]
MQVVVLSLGVTGSQTMPMRTLRQYREQIPEGQARLPEKDNRPGRQQKQPQHPRKIDVRFRLPGVEYLGRNRKDVRTRLLMK